MIHHIIKELQKIESLEERQKEAKELFRISSETIPSGQYDPDDLGYYFTKEDAENGLLHGESFFDELNNLLDRNLPTFAKEYCDDFRKNAEYSKKLLSMDRGDFRNLEIHEKFPFWNNLDKTIHKFFKRGWSDLEIREVNFSTEIAGKGSFATIYKATDKDNNSYALKLFRPLESYNDGDRHDTIRNLSMIGSNITSQRELFSQDPFAKLRAESHMHLGRINCYLMDFANGKNVSELINNGLTKDNESRILLTYTEMIKNLHENEKIFMDLDWGSVILNKDDVRICDYDTVTPINDLEGKPYLAHASYSSREFYERDTPTKQSDLESLALMTDHLFLGATFQDYDRSSKSREEASSNKKIYPKNRARKIPKQLRKVVSGLISYPRDDSLTAEDFVSAVRQDYGV